MSEVIPFPVREQRDMEAEGQRLLHRLFAVATIAERAEASAYTAHAVAPTNAMKTELQQAAIHLRRAYRLAVDQITQPPRGAA